MQQPDNKHAGVPCERVIETIRIAPPTKGGQKT
jgi:hypothetical protein